MVRQWRPAQTKAWLAEQSRPTTTTTLNRWVDYMHGKARLQIRVERARSNDLVAPALELVESSASRIRLLWKDISELEDSEERMKASWAAAMVDSTKFTPHSSEATALKQLVLARKDLLEQLRKEENQRRELLQDLGMLDKVNGTLTVNKTVSVGIDIRILAQEMNAMVMRYVPQEKRKDALEFLKAKVMEHTPDDEQEGGSMGRALPANGEDAGRPDGPEGMGAPAGTP